MLNLLMQSPLLIDGGFIAGVGVGLGAATAGVSWAIRQLRASPSTNGRVSEKEMEFRIGTKATLDRLTGIAENQQETQALAVQTLGRLTDRLEQHDERSARAGADMQEAREMLRDIHRRLGRDP